LHPTDAQTYWISSKIPNDQFLLYCFDTDSTAEPVRSEVLRNAADIEQLQLRIADVPLDLGYPRTRSMRLDAAHVLDHGQPGDWGACLSELGTLLREQLDQHETTWRLHLFTAVTGAPRCTGAALVAVLQISHALGDGRVASSLARRLFGDADTAVFDPPARGRFRPIEFIRRSRRAHELDQRLAADTDAGKVPAQAPPRPRTRLNVAPSEAVSIRTVVRDRADLTAPGIGVTAGALTVVSAALSRYLEMHGDRVPSDLGAEVTIAKPGERRARNHFRNAGVGLFPETDDLFERAGSIAAALAQRRARAEHPAMAVSALATEMVPAVLLHWGVRQFDATAVPDAVTGHTVVSSVARGAATLRLGGGPVRFTAGFPALSPVMGLTHGVHGIGETVTFGITSAASAVPDPDVYESILRGAADDVALAFG